MNEGIPLVNPNMVAVNNCVESSMVQEEKKLQHKFFSYSSTQDWLELHHLRQQTHQVRRLFHLVCTTLLFETFGSVCT